MTFIEFNRRVTTRFREVYHYMTLAYTVVATLTFILGVIIGWLLATK
jgi:hypothetical protein